MTNEHTTHGARGFSGWLSLLLMAGTMALSASACGDGQDDGAGAPSPAATATQVTVDQDVARQLQDVLDAAVADPEAEFAGTILRVSGDEFGTWTGTAGIGELETATPMRADDKFRAGSIVKTFIAVVVLQLAEEGRLSLDDPLPAVLPESVHSRFGDSARITVRMLLNHSSGLAEWLGAPVYVEIAADPGRVWDTTEFLEMSAAQPANFPPGEGYRYSNTNYNLLGEVIAHVTGNSWRHEVTERVIRPLALENTLVPEPGDPEIPGNYAHGYAGPADLTNVDPSMAGAAGGSALISTVSDLSRYWESVLAGELFEEDATLREMLTYIDAPDEGGQVGYGLGVQRYVFPDGTELIGHLGGAPGYRSFVGYLPAENLTVATVMNAQVDPSPVLLPAAEILRAAASP